MKGKASRLAILLAVVLTLVGAFGVTAFAHDAGTKFSDHKFPVASTEATEFDYVYRCIDYASGPDVASIRFNLEGDSKEIVYDGQGHGLTVVNPMYKTESGAWKALDSTVLYKKSDESAYSNTLPRNVGNYDAKITFTYGSEGDQVIEISDVIEIKKRPLAVKWVGDDSVEYDGQPHGKTLELIEGTTLADGDSFEYKGASSKIGNHKSSADIVRGTGEDREIVTNNYKVTQSGSRSYEITAKEVGIRWTDLQKVYNGENQFPTATVNGACGDDKVSAVVVVAGGESKDAGQYTATVKELTGEDSGNYALATEGRSTTFDIAEAEAKVTEISVADAQYDGNADVELDDVTFTLNVFGEDNVIVTGAVGTYDSAEPGDRIATFDFAGASLDGDAASNYIFNKTDSVNEAQAKIIGTGVATLVTAPQLRKTEYTGQDLKLIRPSVAPVAENGTVVYSLSPMGEFSEEVPTGKNAGPYTVYYTVEPNPGYTYDGGVEQLDSEIVARNVNVSGITAKDKPYDGTQEATLDFTTATITGNVDGENLKVTATGTFDTKDAGEDKTVNITHIALDGPAKDNYNLKSATTGTATATITPCEVVVSNITAEDRQYDGTRVATLVLTNAEFKSTDETPVELPYEGDNLYVLSATGKFDNKNVGKDKTVTISDIELGGTAVDAGNYILAEEGQQTETTASIEPREVVVSGITAANKVYDGTTAATLVLTNAEFKSTEETPEVLPYDGDALEVSAATGTFEDKNVGEEKTVAITGITLGGADAGNYALAKEGQQTEAKANITAKPVKVRNITAEDKTYDGYKTATVILDNAQFTGVLPDDELSITDGVTGEFDTADAGKNKTVTLAYADVTFDGADAANYMLAEEGNQATTKANIDRQVVTLKWFKDEDSTDDDRTSKPIKYEFDKESHVPFATATGTVEGKEATLRVFVDGAKVDAGTYTATATSLKAQRGSSLNPDNFELPTNKAKQFTIDPYEVTINWYAHYYDDEPVPAGTPIRYTYDGSSQAPVAEAVGVDESDTFDVNVTGARVNSNEYEKKEIFTAYATELEAPWPFFNMNNYVLPSGSNARKHFYIDKAGLTVKADDKTKVYGDADPAEWTYSITEGKLYYNEEAKAMDALTAALQREEGSNVGSYAIDFTSCTAETDNYAITTVPGTLTITPATVTVTAKDQTINYGQDYDKSAKAVTYKGWKGTDDESVLTTKPVLSSNYFVNAKAGTYTLKASGAAADNYTFTYVNGKLTVNDVVSTLVAQGKASGKKAVVVSWNGVTGAASYDVYLAKCNTKKKTYAPKYKGTTSGNSFKVKKLKKGTCYKYFVVAKAANGAVIAQSEVGHFIAGNVKGKKTNAKSITASTNVVSLNKGGSYALTTSQAKAKGGKKYKLLNGGHASLTRYISSNPAVATVGYDNGVITAVGGGYCKVYAIAVNGMWSEVEVYVN